MDRTKALYGPRTQASRETNNLEGKLQVLDRTMILYGPRTQASGETNNLEETVQVLDRTKAYNVAFPLSSWFPHRHESEENSPLTVGLVPKLHGFPSLLSDPQYQKDWCNIERYVTKKHNRSPSLLGYPLRWII